MQVSKGTVFDLLYELIFTILHLNFKSVFILNHYECFDYLKHGLLHASSSVMTLSRNLKNTYQIVWLFFFFTKMYRDTTAATKKAFMEIHMYMLCSTYTSVRELTLIEKCS